MGATRAGGVLGWDLRDFGAPGRRPRGSALGRVALVLGAAGAFLGGVVGGFEPPRAPHGGQGGRDADHGEADTEGKPALVCPGAEAKAQDQRSVADEELPVHRRGVTGGLGAGAAGRRVGGFGGLGGLRFASSGGAGAGGARGGGVFGRRRGSARPWLGSGLLVPVAQQSHQTEGDAVDAEHRYGAGGTIRLVSHD